MALGEWSHHRDYLGHENLFCTVLLCILNNMHISIPISQIIPSPFSRWQCLFSTSVTLFASWKYVHFYHFLDFIYKQHRMLSLCLTFHSVWQSWIHPCFTNYIILLFFFFNGWAIFHCIYGLQDFPGGSDGKAAVCNMGDPGSIPGLGRSPGEGNDNPLQYYCLENPTDKGAW